MDCVSMTNNDKVLAVAGADLDIALVKGLDKGDKILLEMNGVRMPATSHPLVADEPWLVLSNDAYVLRLRHPRWDTLVLDLPYENIHTNNPAVFRIYNSAFGLTTPIYVILQFVAYYASSGEIKTKYATTFNEDGCREGLDDDLVRNGLLETLHGYFQNFSTQTFKHQSIKRFALRSHVGEQVINDIKDGDWQKVLDISDDDLVKIVREVSLLPHLLESGKMEIETGVYGPESQLPLS